MNLTLHSIAYPVTALGPGQRVVMWVSGCSLRCKGCITPELQQPHAGKSIPVSTLARHLMALPTLLSGLSLTGGEPFDQSEALAELVSNLRENTPEWDVLAFSGYQLEYLQRDRNRRRLLSLIDILVDGPYVAGRPGVHPLAASNNQRIHYLNEHGERLRDAMEDQSFNHANLGLGDGDGNLLIGILDPSVRVQIHRGISLSGR